MPYDRLADLLQMSVKTPQKPIIWYGLAMEYRSRGQRDDSVKAFEKCVEVDAGYVPAYFQWGMTLDEMGKRPDAIALLKKGLVVARQKGDRHAEGEMAGQLEMWDAD